MGWKTVSLEKIPTWDYKIQKELIGVFLGKRDNIGPNNSSMYDFEVEGGKKISVWANAGLNGAMNQVMPGMELKITYNGMQENPKTKRKFHSFEVAYKE